MALLGDRESRLLIDGKLVAGSGRHVHDGQPRHRRGARRRGRREPRRHGRGDRGGPHGVRRHRLGHQHRTSGALHSAAAAGHARPRRGAAGADDRRGRGAAHADSRGASRWPGRGSELLPPTRRRPTRGGSISVMRRRRASRPTARRRARPSASSAPSRRGTSRTRSTWPRSAPHWRRETPWCSSPLPTPRGARRCSAS